MSLPQGPETCHLSNQHFIPELDPAETERIDRLNERAGRLMLQNQDFTKSLELSEQALSLAERIGHESGRAWALLNMGSCLSYTDLSSEPYKMLKESLEIFRRLNDPVGEAHALMFVGLANLSDEKYVSAYYKIEQGLNLSILSNCQKGEILAYYLLALLSEKLEDHESTVRYCRLALSMAEDFDLKARVLAQMGTTLILTGRPQHAKNYLKEALEESVFISDDFSKAIVYIQLGKIYLTERKIDKAKEHLRKGLRLANEIGLFDHSNLVIEDISDSYLEFQDYGSALEILEEFKKAVETNENPRRLAIVLMKIASVRLRMGETEGTPELLERVWKIAREGENKKLKYECQKAFAEVYETLGDIARAFEHYKRYHRFKEDFDNVGTANKIQLLADRLNIENERNIKQVTREKNAEVASMVYEVCENIDKLQQAKQLIETLRNENEKLQSEYYCVKCRVRGEIHVTLD